jgi:hypothetical protein
MNMRSYHRTRKGEEKKEPELRNYPEA